MKPLNVRRRRDTSPAAKTGKRAISRSSAEAPRIWIHLKEDGVFIALLLIVAALYFLPVLGAGNHRVLSAPGTDVWNQYFYWRHFGFAALARGELPLWNPYIFSGTPYIAGIQSAVFYPLNLVFLASNTPSAINLSIALHCFLASVFTFLYARFMGLAAPPSLLSALTFAYGAPYFLHIYAGHLSNLSTMAWLPLLFMSVEALLRTGALRYAFLGGVVISLQVFAGHPQYLFYSVIAVAIYFILNLIMGKAVSPWAGLLGGFGLLITSGLALSAVQLLPSLELTGQSVREALSYEWVAVFSFPPENLVTLLAPDFFGDIVTVPYWGKNYLWEMSIYLGIIPLVTAITAVLFERARPVKVFALIASISLLLAFGKHTPLLGILYGFVPGFNLFRGLSKFVYIFAFASSLLAGYGLAKIAALAESEPGKMRGLVLAVFAAAVALLICGFVIYALGQNVWRSLVESLQSAEDQYARLTPVSEEFLALSGSGAFSSIVKTSLILGAFGSLLWFFRGFTKLPPAQWSLVAVALAAGDLWFFGFRYLVTFDPAQLSSNAGLRKFFQEEKEPFRVATPVFSLLNAGLLEGMENVGGYDAIVLKPYSEFINLTQNLPMEEPNIVMSINRFSPALRLLNVKYYILESSMNVAAPGLEPVLESGGYRVYRDHDALPRSYIVHQARIIQDEKAALRALAGPRFQGASTAIVAGAVENLPDDPQTHSPPPIFVARSLNRVVLDARLNAPGLLVLSDAYYPGWKAFIDGKMVSIYRVNHVVRGVSLPAGRHRVEFRYEPFSVRLGAFISLGGGVLMIAIMAWPKMFRTAQRGSARGNL